MRGRGVRPKKGQIESGGPGEYPQDTLSPVAHAQIATFDEANASLDEQEYMISKKWIDLWRKGDVGNMSPSDAPFSLFCQHGNRWDKDHKSIRITGEALMLLRSIFGDFDTYTDEEPMCGQCAEDFAGDEEALIAFNRQRKEEQGLMRKWVKTPNQPVVFNEEFHLLPNEWWDGWHAWSNGGGTVPRPILEMGICEHEKLNWDPTTEPARYTSKAGWREITSRWVIVLSGFNSWMRRCSF